MNSHEVRKIAHKIPVNVIGTDDQGRTLVQCPSRGCGDIAYIADDGRLVCPSGEAIEEFLRDHVDPYLDRLYRSIDALSDRQGSRDVVPPTVGDDLSNGVD